MAVDRRERPNCRRIINRLLEERNCTLEELLEGNNSFQLGGGLPIQARKMLEEQKAQLAERQA